MHDRDVIEICPRCGSKVKELYTWDRNYGAKFPRVCYDCILALHLVQSHKKPKL